MIQLKNIRKKIGLNQAEIAHLLNTTQHTISNYEKGKTQPSIEDIIKLSEYFNISSDELLGITKKQDVNLTEKNALLKTIDSLTEIECHKLKIFAEGLISNRIEKTSAFKVLKDDRE